MSQKSAKELADELVAVYADGFQVADIWATVSTLMDYAEDFFDEGGVKKDFVLAALDEVLSQVDLPGPDFITRRAVMWLAPSVVDRFAEFKFG